MVEVWFSIKIYLFLITISAMIALIIFSALLQLFGLIKYHRKIKWLKNHGFIRELFDVPSVKNEALYGWRNKRNCKQIDERDLKNMTYKELVKKMTDKS